MSSRRGAVRVNPVTGKIEKYEPTEGPDGVTRHRDGCLVVDERYINAAREIGLGGEQGMYGHMKALTRMNAGDIPTGSSIEREGQYSAANRASKHSLDAKNTKAVASAIAADAKKTGSARIHGFNTSSRPKASDIHVGHASAFNRQKGVVNTVGGAKDVNRKTNESPPRLPAKGERKGAQIMGFSTLDAHTAEGKARRAAAEKRESTGHGPKANMVHVSGGGGRMMGFNGPIKTADRLGQAAPVSSRATSKPATTTKSVAVTSVLGGSSGNVAGGSGAAVSVDREKRAQYFQKMFEERENKKKEAMGVL